MYFQKHRPMLALALFVIIGIARAAGGKNTPSPNQGSGNTLNQLGSAIKSLFSSGGQDERPAGRSTIEPRASSVDLEKAQSIFTTDRDFQIALKDLAASNTLQNLLPFSDIGYFSSRLIRKIKMLIADKRYDVDLDNHFGPIVADLYGLTRQISPSAELDHGRHFLVYQYQPTAFAEYKDSVKRLAGARAFLVPQHEALAESLKEAINLADLVRRILDLVPRCTAVCQERTKVIINQGRHSANELDDSKTAAKQLINLLFSVDGLIAGSTKAGALLYHLTFINELVTVLSIFPGLIDKSRSFDVVTLCGDVVEEILDLAGPDALFFTSTVNQVSVFSTPRFKTISLLSALTYLSAALDLKNSNVDVRAINETAKSQIDRLKTIISAQMRNTISGDSHNNKLEGQFAQTPFANQPLDKNTRKKLLEIEARVADPSSFFYLRDHSILAVHLKVIFAEATSIIAHYKQTPKFLDTYLGLYLAYVRAVRGMKTHQRQDTDGRPSTFYDFSLSLCEDLADRVQDFELIFESHAILDESDQNGRSAYFRVLDALFEAHSILEDIRNSDKQRCSERFFDRNPRPAKKESRMAETSNLVGLLAGEDEELEGSIKPDPVLAMSNKELSKPAIGVVVGQLEHLTGSEEQITKLNSSPKITKPAEQSNGSEETLEELETALWTATNEPTETKAGGSTSNQARQSTANPADSNYQKPVFKIENRSGSLAGRSEQDLGPFLQIADQLQDGEEEVVRKIYILEVVDCDNCLEDLSLLDYVRQNNGMCNLL